jgi:hypothetical protein
MPTEPDISGMIYFHTVKLLNIAIDCCDDDEVKRLLDRYEYSDTDLYYSMLDYQDKHNNDLVKIFKNKLDKYYILHPEDREDGFL